ncbi:MAG: antitoxin [Syntrophorhabdus sp.]
MRHHVYRKLSGNYRGVALVTSLMVISIAAGIFAAVMYFALTGTEISNLQRKYQSSKEASLGAIDVFTKDILPRTMSGTNLSTAISGMAVPGVMPLIQANVGQDPCFKEKLSKPTAQWSAGLCNNNPDPLVNSDIVFNLKSASAATRPYVVNVKIIDTVKGNSDKSGMVLEIAGGVVDDRTGMVEVRHYPWLYTIVTDARPQNSTTERANIEVLYAY